MAALLGRLFGGSTANAVKSTDDAFPPIAVDRPFVAIGDIHGCDDLLGRLLDKLAVEAPDAELVFLGDYIDRGAQSAEVLRRLMELEEVFFLLGNHERMLLDFIDDPDGKGARWLDYGGLQTLAAFGVAGSSKEPVRLRDAVVAAMGDDMIEWIRDLALTYANGNVLAVHAAADPEAPVNEQAEDVLIWGHPKFGEQPRRDGCWVVHGHTVVDAPQISQGVVSIDTGAYATGRLSAAIFDGNAVQMVQI